MSDKWDLAVKKLIELTEAGSLKWSASPQIGGARDESVKIIGPVYTSKLNGKRIAVFQAQAYKWVDQYEDLMPYDPKVVIEFINDADQSELTWPGPYGRWQLLEAIQKQYTDADEYLDTLLAS